MPKRDAPCRIAFLIRDLGHGGAQRQLVTLASALAKDADFQVTVVHFYTGVFEAELQAAQVQTLCVGKRHRWDLLGFFVRLVSAMRRIQPQVIHGYLHESNLMALLLKPLCGFPKVIWGIRDSQTDADTWGLLGKLSFRLNCLLSGWADLIIANSQAGRSYYKKKGYPGERFEVVPNGIDAERFHPTPRTEPGCTFAMIGRLHTMKDHPTFLRALARVPEAKAVIIGNGEAIYAAELRALAGSLGLTERIEWRPACDDLAPIYPQFDALVSTSAYGEGFSNVIGEAMACGLPCLASDVGDSAWLVEEARWTFKAGDDESLGAMMRAFLALSQEQRQALGQKNRQRIEQHFTLEKMVERSAALCLARPQSVLWLTTGLGTGGAEMMLTQLLSGLKQHRHTVISLTAGGKYIEPLRAAGVTVHTLDMPAGKPTPRGLWRLCRFAWQARPDVIMGWMYHGCLAAVLVKLFRFGQGRVIWNIRQSLYDLALEKRGSAWVIQSLAKLSWLTETITYNSQLSARQHEAIGYPRNKTRLIPNGFDLATWSPKNRDLDPDSPTRNAFTLGRFGRFTAMKDYPTFLQAAALVTQELPETRFLLVGTGVDESNPELTALIAHLGLCSNMQLLGERHDLPSLTASLDLAVSSSAFGEGFPNVVGEAMACAVPVVATDIGDTAWVLGDTGRLVPAKDPQALASACLELLRLAPEVRRQMGERGRQRIVEHFSLRSVLEQFDQLLITHTRHP